MTYLDPNQSPRIGLEHLEFQARRVADRLAADRHPAGKGNDQTAQRIDLVSFFLAEDPPEMFVKRLDGDARIGIESSRRGAPQKL